MPPPPPSEGGSPPAPDAPGDTTGPAGPPDAGPDGDVTAAMQGVTREPDGTLEIRPSWATYKAKVLQVPVFLVVFLGVMVVRNGMATALAIGVPTAVLSMAGVWLYFKRAVTRVGPNGLVKQGIIGRTEASHDELGEAILVRHLSSMDSRMDAILILTDRAGDKVASWGGMYWSADQLTAMASALQLPTWAPDQRLSFADIKERHPDAVAMYQARPYLFAAVVAVAIIAAAMLIGWAMFKFG